MFRATPQKLVPLAALAIGVVLLAGCSSTPAAPSESSAPITDLIVVSGQSAQNGAILQSVFDAYNATPGSNTVTLQMNADSDIQTAQKVLVDIAAGTVPDAVRVTTATYQTMIDSGAAQPADVCLASDPSVVKSLNESLIDNLKVDGTVYQIPWYVTPNALFYNAKLFSDAGLDVDSPPETMSEFHEAARAIAALGVAGGTAYFGNDFNFQSYVASLGGTIYDPATKKLKIDSAAGKAVFTAFADMAADGSSPVYSNYFADANAAFAGGKLGMIVTSASGYPALKASGNVDIRIAPAPYMDGGKAVAATSTNGFVITTKDPARQKAVCAALLSLLSPEAVTATVTATATIPLVKSVIDDEKFLAPVYAANPGWASVRDQPTVAWQSLPGAINAEYSTNYVDDQLRALRGDLSGAEAAAALHAATEQLLKGL